MYSYTIILVLCVCFAVNCKLNPAQRIIKNFDAKNSVVTIKFLYFDNPESFTLAEIQNVGYLHHINKYLEKHHKTNATTTLVITTVNGFTKINGLYMYDIEPIFNELILAVSCTDNEECNHIKLFCEMFYEDNEAIFNELEIMPNYGNLNRDLLIQYNKKNVTLSEVSTRKNLLHIAESNQIKSSQHHQNQR